MSRETSQAAAAGPPPEDAVIERERTRFQQGSRGLLLAFFAFTGTATALWALWRPEYLAHDDDLVYDLGLVGGLLLLSQFLYSLRKHHPRLRHLGNLKTWFTAHVAVGLIAPLVILVHSRFDIQSLNGGVAFYTMLVVVASGFVGRYLLAKVNFDFVGERLRLKALHDALRRQILEQEPELAPRIAQTLKGFMNEAFAPATPFQAIAVLLRLGWRWRAVYRELVQLGRPLAGGAADTGGETLTLEAPFLREAFQPAQRQLLRRYLQAVVRLARYHAYRRLFAWWRMAHVPVVYILLAAGLAHVLAVHMY